MTQVRDLINFIGILITAFMLGATYGSPVGLASYFVFLFLFQIRYEIEKGNPK